MATELIPRATFQQIAKLDETIRESRKQIQEAEQSPMLKGLLVARSMQLVREQLTADLMSDVMLLRGTPLGFTTDRDNPGKDGDRKGYPVEVVRDCLIECLLKGYRPVGGEMCVIAGRFYAAKPGNRRLVTEWPGLTDLKLQVGVPKSCDGGALVPFRASWKLNGIPDQIDCVDQGGQDMRIPVRVNQGMIVDAILGKAEAKMYARILSRLSGSLIDSAEDAEDELILEGTCQPSPEPTAKEKDPQRTLPGISPLEAIVAAFDALDDVGEVSRLHRKSVTEYPDYQDQIDGLAEAAKERIRCLQK